MENKNYLVGTNTIDMSWRAGQAQQITFVVTQECNLRCKYCYMTDKNKCNVMSFDVAKNAIDYFIDNKEALFTTDYVILDFIGGEPLLEMTLIKQIIDYFVLSTYQKKSPWFGRFRVSIQSNGVLVGEASFQKLLKRHENLIGLSITIDGTEEKHDMQRVFPDGTGSYKTVEANFNMMLSKGISLATKITFAHDDLGLVKDSVVHLWNLGLKSVPGNVVFEDVWKDGDSELFKQQLISLADYIIDNKLWNERDTGFFSDLIGFKADDDALMSPTCGTGGMYCVDAKGDIYNCVRFMDYSLNNKSALKFGNIYSGIDPDRVRPFKTLFKRHLNDQECMDCKINHSCPHCPGFNYDETPADSLYHRAKFNCEMFKSQVRANNYYWARLYNEHNIKRVYRGGHFVQEFFMYFILASDSVSFCNFTSDSLRNEKMEPEDLIEGLKFAHENFLQPIFVHSKESMKWLSNMLVDPKYGEPLSNAMKYHAVKNIISYEEGMSYRDTIYVINENADLPMSALSSPVVLSVSANNIGGLSDLVKRVLPFTSRVVLNIMNIGKDFDLREYETQLNAISDFLYDYFIKTNVSRYGNLQTGWFSNVWIIVSPEKRTSLLRQMVNSIFALHFTTMKR